MIFCLGDSIRDALTSAFEVSQLRVPNPPLSQNEKHRLLSASTMWVPPDATDGVVTLFTANDSFISRKKPCTDDPSAPHRKATEAS